MSVGDRGYPRAVALEGGAVTLRSMTSRDRDALLAFTSQLPAHDLLFLPIDVTRADAVDHWVHAIERDTVTTVIAERDGVISGYAAIDRGQLDWSKHVGELRVVVAASMRGKGLGRLLMQEAFALALGLGLEKMVAHMTVDQKGAIAVFEGMGFRPEALLRDHVKDRDGRTHDLLILSHDVRRFSSQMEAYGVSDALER